MTGNQYFLLPFQPDPEDRRPRNAFGFLIGFGRAAKAYYKKRDRKNRYSEAVEAKGDMSRP